MEIDLPGLPEQRMYVYQQRVEESCALLRKNLSAPHYDALPGFDAAPYGTAHLATQENGWEPPHADLINTWFEQFKLTFPEYRSDEKIAHLLGLHSKNGDRRIRAFRNGDQPIPYGLWRRFLELTGRVNQEITPVLGFFAD
ncbi:hypothetical protein [Nissabacter sp. SGAir0207]|uniref:hypothetical protein n=1 Tax=Nissabacter sp. SGAir0207 TaxID=2126321 RepID=UPI0010CCF9F2|nr:hypothetical protein [Nissabacter sp. SGAir0207]QCR38887.1 hypothetical protein C1N62_22500 [Nissabacter sp. SGAir0207]